MTGPFGALCRYWYAPAPADRLAVIRVPVGLYVLWYLWTRQNMLASLGRSDRDLYEPVGIFRLLSHPIDPIAFDWMIWLTVVLGVLFVLGFVHRYVGPLFSLLLLATFCYRNSWSMIYHTDNLLVVYAVILGFTRSADAFSVDAMLRARAGMPPPGPADIYGWPTRLMCAATATTYFLAGVAKLAAQGFSWADGAALRGHVAVDAVRKEVLEGGAPLLAGALYDQVWLFTLMGIGTYVIELGAPFFLPSRIASRVWAVSTWLMHWSIFFIMGIEFRLQLSFIAFLPFFNVERIAQLARRLWPREPPELASG